MTFNDHVGSTKSYLHTRKHRLEVVQADFVPKEREISAEYAPGTTTSVTMHDGSIVRFTKVAENYDPTDRLAAQTYIQGSQEKGEIPTGLLYLDESAGDMHDTERTVDTPLAALPFEQLCPAAPRSNVSKALIAEAENPNCRPMAAGGVGMKDAYSTRGWDRAFRGEGGGR